MSNDIVQVNVSLEGPGIQAATFDVPLILTPRPSWTERVRSYDLTGTFTASGIPDDFASDTPEYAAALAIASQTPKLPSLKFGRCALKPTMKWVLTLETITALAHYKVNAYAAAVKQSVDVIATAAPAWLIDHGYTQGQRVTNDTAPVKVYECITSGTGAHSGGPTGTAADITDNDAHWKYLGTSTSGTCNDAIIEDLVTALNALATPDLGATAAATGTPGALVCTVTGDAPGNWFALEPLNNNVAAAVPTLMSVAETTVDPGIATDLAAIAAEDNSWYGLISLYRSAAIISTATVGLAAWAEANLKQVVVALVDTHIATAADGGADDVAHVLKGAGYKRTAPFFHPRASEFADAAELAAWFADEPGHDDGGLNKTLVGVTPVVYSGTQKTNLKAKHCNFYYELGAGAYVVGGEGREASGQFMDVIRDTDQMASWYTEELTNLKLTLAAQGQKLPFTDLGVAQVEGKVRKVNSDGIDAGIVSPNPPPTISVPKVSSVSSTDKAARILRNVNTAWQLAGAIHAVEVNVTVSY